MYLFINYDLLCSGAVTISSSSSASVGSENAYDVPYSVLKDFGGPTYSRVQDSNSQDLYAITPLLASESHYDMPSPTVNTQSQFLV